MKTTGHIACKTTLVYSITVSSPNMAHTVFYLHTVTLIVTPSRTGLNPTDKVFPQTTNNKQ